MHLRKYLLLGPLYFIKKRQYLGGIIALLFQFTIPLQLMSILHGSIYWTAFKNIWITAQQHTIAMSDLYILFLSHYYCIMTAPVSLIVTILLTRFFWGYLAHYYVGTYEQKLQYQGPRMLTEDSISSCLAALGYSLAFLGLIFAGIPYEHAFHPEDIHAPYLYQEAIQQLDSQILGSLKIGGVTIAYLLFRMVLANLRYNKLLNTQ